MCSKKNDAFEGSLSCMEHMGKICIVCNQDCSPELLYKDPHGRYICDKCYFLKALSETPFTKTEDSHREFPDE